MFYRDKEAHKVLNKKLRFEYKAIILVLFFVMLTDVLSIGSIGIFVSFIIDPSQLQNFFKSDIFFQKIFNLNLNERVFLGSIIVFILFFIKNLLVFLSNYFIIDFSYKLKVFLSTKLFSSNLNKNYEQYLKINSSTSMKNLTREINLFVNFIKTTASLNGNILILTGLFILITINFKMIALYGLIFISIVGYLIFIIFKSRLIKISKLREEADRSLYKIINETNNFFKEIFIFNLKSKFISKFKDQIFQSESYNKLINIINVFPKILIELIFIGSFLFYFVFNDELHQIENFLPEFTILLLSIVRALPILNQVSMSLNQLKFLSTTKKVILNEMKYIDINNRSKFKKNKNIIFKDLKLKNINFGYNKDNRILKSINFNLTKGQKLLILGPSGCGKSTLVNIILGLIQPDTGTVKFNNTNIEKNIVDWHNVVSHVSQDIYLLDDTIKNNITLSDNPDLKKLKDISNFLSLTKNKKININHTKKIGDKGKKISGGQKQRISLGRALYKNSQILILDEPTSSLDHKLEKKIINHLLNQKDKTIILVAHKFDKFKSKFNKIIKLN